MHKDENVFSFLSLVNGHFRCVMTHGCASEMKKATAVALRVCVCVCVCAWQEKWLKKEMGFVLTEANDSDNQTLPPTHSHTHRQEAHTDKLSCSFFHLHTWALIRHAHTHARTHTGWNDPPIYSSSVCTAERWWTREDGLQSPAGTHTQTQQAQQMHPHTHTHIRSLSWSMERSCGGRHWQWKQVYS